MAAGRGGTERAAPAPMHGAEEAAAGAAGGPRVRAASTQTDSMAGERGCTAARPVWRLSLGCVCVCAGGVRCGRRGGARKMAARAVGLRGEPYSRHQALQPGYIPRERPFCLPCRSCGVPGAALPGLLPLLGVLCVAAGSGTPNLWG